MKIYDLGLIAYEEAYQRMQGFSTNRNADTEDEIWLCEHPPVFTLGWHGDPAHLLDAHGIPVVETDRGGQVTYHGPGQLMGYFLVDLKRQKQGIAAFVCAIEKAVIVTLKDFGIEGHLRPKMPGVYVDNKKICSIGLRVKNGKTYHGLALNVDMDLTPFTYINPCGYSDLQMTQMCEWTKCTMTAVKAQLLQHLQSASAC